MHINWSSNFRWMGRADRGVSFCVAYHSSRVSGASGSKMSVFLLCLSSFSCFTSSRYSICLRSSFMVVSTNVSMQASLKRLRSNENFPMHLFISTFPPLARVNWWNLQRNTLWAPLMMWGLEVSLKYLTPSAALRDSRSRSPWYISTSPVSLFFSVSPRFSASSTVKSNQSSIKTPRTWIRSLIHQKWRNLRRDPISCCALICRLCAIWSNQRFGRFVSVLYWKVIKIFLIVTHWPCWSTQVIHTHAGPCSRQVPLFFFLVKNQLLYHSVYFEQFFLCGSYVTEYSKHETRFHATVMILSLLWIVYDTEVKKMMITRIVSMSSLFVHNAYRQIPMRSKLTGWPWVKQTST